MKPAGEQYCEASLTYSAGMAGQQVDVCIHDGRAALDALEYEDCGFTLLEHRSKVEDWNDASQVQDVHRPEIGELAADFSGCDRVIVYPPLVRSQQAAREVPDFAPVEFVHSDYTDDYRAMIEESDRPYRTFLAPLLAAAGVSPRELAAADRVLMLQFWRNIGAERPDYPLALCDASCVARSQLNVFLVHEYGGQVLDFETFGILAPADPSEHHWYTFPSLTRDEVIAFRTYDSRCVAEDRAFWTPHTAFRDPNVGPEAPTRESVEMRALCLFGV